MHVFKLRRECFEEGVVPVGGGAGGVTTDPSVSIAPPADAPYAFCGIFRSVYCLLLSQRCVCVCVVGCGNSEPIAASRAPASSVPAPAPAAVVGITPSSEAVDESNKGSSLSFMKGFLPKYFSSEWSYAQFRVGDSRCICAFGHEPGTIIGTS